MDINFYRLRIQSIYPSIAHKLLWLCITWDNIYVVCKIKVSINVNIIFIKNASAKWIAQV